MNQIKTQKQVDHEIERAYYRIAAGQQIKIMQIPRVFADSRKAILAGATVDQAVRAAVLMYCEVAK